MIDVIRRPPRREETEPAEILCTRCPAKCCRYFALPIDAPTSWTDFDTIRWFLLHERATVFTDEGTWYLLVHSRCRSLRPDNLCDTYETRPGICRSYSTNNCEHADGAVYDQYWETPQQIEEYAEAVLGPRRGHGFRSKRPAIIHGDKPPGSQDSGSRDSGSLACSSSPGPWPLTPGPCS